MVALERLLQRTKPFGAGQGFHRPHALAIQLNGKHQAGFHHCTIDLDGAHAADTLFAAHVSASQTAFVAKVVGSVHPDRHMIRSGLAVDVDRNFNLIGCRIHLRFSTWFLLTWPTAAKRAELVQ
jgi:hypothetical protein